jgi:hypothetical protein
MMDTKRREEPLTVFISLRDSDCDECERNLGKRAFIHLVEGKRALCLDCADLGHLFYLPRGDAALTRRARRHSNLNAIVLKWSRSRKRYERQGVLVDEAALQTAEEECLADSEARARRRERDARRREKLDEEYVAKFAARIQELFPGCPAGTNKTIAEHACLKNSGRVGRTSWAKDLSQAAIRMAVVAHIRHEQTDYDLLLQKGYDRFAARRAVESEVSDVLALWEGLEYGS